MDERIESGMRIQLAGWRSAMGLADVERVGWKVGLNAPPVMEALEIDRPVIGWLGSGTTLAAPAEFVTAGATKIGAEPELAITVGEGGNVAGLAPAIEIVDVDKSFDDLAAILADNIFHRGVVFGPQSEPRALPGITARIACDGEPEASSSWPTRSATRPRWSRSWPAGWRRWGRCWSPATASSPAR